MAVGAGSATGTPSVLQFSSPDLRRWVEDGVLAETGDDGAGPGGAVWECPQLFRLDGAWVLLVSVWDEVPGGVACAVGDHDGVRFTARSWHRLAGDPLYATTTFDDAAGRRCAMSWVQDAGPAEGAWAGTLTVPWLLSRDGDRVGVRPHPDVDSLRTGLLVEAGPVVLGERPLDAGPVGDCCDIELVAGATPMSLALRDDDGLLLGVDLDPGAATATLSTRARGVEPVPLLPTSDGDVSLRLLVDTTVVELFASCGAVAAIRTRPPAGTVSLSASGPGATLRRLVVHGMARVLDPLAAPG
jgi:beta-fructofuranosidase